MSVRKQSANRLTLYRVCGTCNQEFVTTADSPWVRQVPRDGKRQATTYYCSQGCYAASYKHIGWFDGLTAQRRAEKEAKRDISAKNKRYYDRHREQEQARARARYWSDPESARADQAYQRAKRKLLAESNQKGSAMNYNGRSFRQDLKPCPKCGMSSGRRMVTDDVAELYIVRCESCGYQTPPRKTQSGASRIWNRGSHK